MQKLRIYSLLLLLALFLPIPLHTTYLAAKGNNDPLYKRVKKTIRDNPKKTILVSALAAFALAKAGLYGYMYRGKPLGMEQDVIGTEPFGDKQPLLFSHGYGGNKRQLYHYTTYKKDRPNALFSDNSFFYSTFNYPEVTKKPDLKSIKGRSDRIEYYTNIHKVNFAQRKDIETLLTALEHLHRSLEKKTKIVCHGVSRGAATLITAAGSNPHLFSKKVAALILESPFVSVNEVILKKTTFLPLPDKAILSSVKKLVFSGFKPSGIHPIQVVDKIPSSLPVLIIHSKKDALIPVSHSRQLYSKLKNAGHENVYLAELDSGKHAQVLWGHNGKEYQAIVHAFNKKYGLPYNPELAQGIDLEQFQPDATVVQARGTDLRKFYKK